MKESLEENLEDMIGLKVEQNPCSEDVNSIFNPVISSQFARKIVKASKRKSMSTAKTKLISEKRVSSKLKIEEVAYENEEDSKVSLNPWAVEDASVFLKYCCPECEFTNSDLQQFTDHALKHHADATVLFYEDKPENSFKSEESFAQNFFEQEPYEMLDERINSNELRIEKNNENSEKENEKQGLKSTHNQVICEICPILILAPFEVVKSHRQEKHMHEKQIFCPYCDHKPKRWFNLYVHIDSKHPEHDEKKFSCTDCKKSFIFESSFKLHFCPKNQKRRICDVCAFECFQTRVLEDHMLLKHNSEGATKLFCEKCGFTTLSTRKLQVHMNFKHNKENHKKCPYCDFSSSQSQKLYIHIDVNHPEEEDKNFLCEKCNKTFIYEASFTDHSKYKCKYSEYLLTNRREHWKKQYDKSRIIFICDYCDEKIKTATSTRIKNHYKNNHPGKNVLAKGHTRYNCTNCDDFFLFKDELNSHLNLDHGVKTDKKYCPRCKKSYVEHHKCPIEYNHLQNNKGKRFPCNQCDKTYSCNVHLKSHIRTVHEKCLDFECTQCGKKLGSNIKLKNHTYYSHSQVNCDTCGKEIANPHDLKRHKVFIHKETEGVWFCDICPKSAFFSKSTFDRHVKDKH